jgi:hypothetical protein
MDFACGLGRESKDFHVLSTEQGHYRSEKNRTRRTQKEKISVLVRVFRVSTLTPLQKGGFTAETAEYAEVNEALCALGVLCGWFLQWTQFWNSHINRSPPSTLSTR